MKNGSEILNNKNSNIFDNLRKLNTLDSTSSSFRPKKVKLRNELCSLMKFSENITPKKLDFPLCFSLFTNDKTNNDNDSKIKENNNIKLDININIKGIKPKSLNNLNLNNIIKPKDKKIISRNPNYFNSLGHKKSKNQIGSFTRIHSPKMNKTAKLIIKKFNYSPSNLILNQIALSPIIKLDTKVNNISNSTIEQDMQLIKNIKGLSINNLNYNINFNDKKLIPSLFSTPRKNENEKTINKRKIKHIKQKIYNDISDFENINDNKSKNNSIKENLQLNNKNTLIDNFDFKKNENEINKSRASNFDEKNKIKIFENRIRLIRNNTFNKGSQKSLKINIEKNNNENKKYYSNKFLYKIDSKSNINLVNNSNIKENTNKKKENNSKNFDLSSFKLENKEENRIKEDINDNKKKLERLNRLKNSSFKKGHKTDNKINVKETKEVDAIKSNIKSRNNSVSIKMKKTDFFIKVKFDDNKEIRNKDNSKEKIKMKSKTSKNLIVHNIDSINLKKSKFYLTIYTRKTHKLINDKIFLNKLNNKLNEISPNNRANRKIYVNKTKMLINIQEKINIIIEKEKSHLKGQNIKNDQKVYFNSYDMLSVKRVKKKDEKNISTFIINNSFNCKICFLLFNSIISSIDFSSIENNIFSVKHKQKCLPNKNNKSKITKRRFQSVKIKKLLENEEEKKEEFSINKTKNLYNNDEEWIYSPINLLSIQKIILRSNDYYFNNKQISKDKKMHRSTVRNYHKNNSLNYEKRKTSKENNLLKQMSLKKFSNMNFLSLKKDIKKLSDKNLNFYEFSLLNQKKFFKRPKMKRKKIKTSSVLNQKIEKCGNNSEESSLSSDKLMSSFENNNNIEDIYFDLISYIIKAKNKQFLKLYEKNKKLININQQLFEGNTLLIISSREGNLHISKFLCSEGIEVNIQNNKGNTALHYAIGNQFYSIADTLTRYGAREDIANDKGLLPWDCVENNLE